MKKFAIGTDIGGSHITCAAVDLQKESVLKESFATREVHHRASAEEILNCWAMALRQSLAGIEPAQLAGIGFAMPGPFDYARGIARFTKEVAKYQHLHGVNISEHLRALLALPAGSDLRFLNDAIAFGVGEAWLGKAAEANRSIAITLGTGFGSAFVDAGIPVVEREDVPPMGCVWHLPFRNDIADAFFSTRWFIKRYAQKSGQQLTEVKQIADRAATDPLAKEVFVEFGTSLGSFLGPWIKRFAVDVLVIGGNVSAAYRLFGKALEKSLKQQQLTTAVRVSELKEVAALIGSARLFEANFWNRVKPLLSKM